MRNGAVAGPINAGGKDFDGMSSRRQGATEAMHREYRTSVAGGGKVRRNDVQQSHEVAALSRPAVANATASEVRSSRMTPPWALAPCSGPGASGPRSGAGPRQWSASA